MAGVADADGDVVMEDGAPTNDPTPSEHATTTEEPTMEQSVSIEQTTSTEQPTLTEQQTLTEQPAILHITIDTRRKEWVFSPIERNEVIFAIEKDHEADVLKTVRRVGRFGSGLYQLTSSDYSRYVGKSVMLRGIEIPLRPFYERPPRSDRSRPTRTQTMRRSGSDRADRVRGLTVTIFDAYDVTTQSIPHEKFDEEFLKLEGIEVIEQTSPQFNGGTRTLNGHRRIEVRNADGSDNPIDVGSYIIVDGNRFNLMYDGLKKMCYLCREKHGKDCPLKKRFEELKQMRKGKTNKRKIYSDSTLRSVNQLALNADVSCMSGGGIGQLCNAIPYDDKHDEVILVAMNNEVGTANDAKEFVYTIDTGVEKVQALAETRTRTAVVLPPAPAVTPEAVARVQYIEEKFKAIESEKLVIVEINNVEYDASNHPSVTGTKNFIHQLETVLGENLVLAEATEEDIATERIYNQVQPMYKAGCRGCDSPVFTRDLCSDCWIKTESVDVSYYERLVEGYRVQMYPDLGRGEEEGVEKESKGEEVVNVEGVIQGGDDVVMGDGKVAHQRDGESDEDVPLAKRVK